MQTDVAIVGILNRLQDVANLCYFASGDAQRWLPKFIHVK